VTAAEADPPALAADYFDGVSARARRVKLRVVGSVLQVDGDGIALRWPLAELRWPERSRHGARVAHASDGGAVQALDAQAWDRWARASGIGESAIVRAQQNWRSALVAVALLVLLAAAGYRWGVPWLARATLAALPASVDRTIGETVLGSLEGQLLLPSTVDAARQQQVRTAFAQALARTEPGFARSRHALRFYASPDRRGADAQRRLGPNAFALPGGTIVVTDEMLTLLQGRDDVLIGVLGHEYGHVRRRHGMRLLVQAALIGTATSIAWGDFSSVLAAAPVLLGQSAYSRDFEREADDDAIALLRADGLSPSVMTELFERLAARRPAAGDGADAFDLGIALASHPADAERVRRFRDAAAR